MFQSLVSVIIVTYNNDNVIRECLKALLHQTYKEFEVIVVDNASQDTTIDIVHLFPDFLLIKSEDNLGFTGGNILGLQYAKGDYIALLNPDTEVCSEWLQVLVKNMAESSHVGICASKLLVYDSGLIDSAGDGCITTGRGFKRGEGKENKLYSNQEDIFGACGGAMLIRKEMIEQIGFLDNDFFLIYEDTDLSFRAQLAGWKCLFIPDAIVYHKVRSSIGNMSDLAVYYSIRNAHFVWVKNMPFQLICKYLHHQIIQEIGSFAFFVIRHKKIGIYFRANFDFIKHLPRLLSKRRKNLKLKKITNRELERILTPLLQSQVLIAKIKKLFV